MVRREGGKQKSAVPLPAAAMFECLLIRSYPAIHSGCLCSSLDLLPSLPEPPTDPADSNKAPPPTRAGRDRSRTQGIKH